MNSNETSLTLRILLVEDNSHDRTAFCRALQKGQLSCEITECVRAEEALEYIQKDEYVEVTPNHLRLRKIFLKETDRKRNKI